MGLLPPENVNITTPAWPSHQGQTPSDESVGPRPRYPKPFQTPETRGCKFPGLRAKAGKHDWGFPHPTYQSEKWGDRSLGCPWTSESIPGLPTIKRQESHDGQLTGPGVSPLALLCVLVIVPCLPFEEPLWSFASP